MAKPGVVPSMTPQQIVEAAFSLINNCGMKVFSMRALAGELGVSVMALYTYFPSKDKLLEAVFARLRNEYDNAPIPGERWDDTLRRTTASIRAVDLRYPEIYRAASGWMPDAQTHTRRVYQLHKDQGMPLEIYRPMWVSLEAFLVGFVHQEIVQRSAVFEPVDPDDADYPWLMISENAYNDESFARGIEFIIDGVRELAAPDPCDWKTPVDRTQWTWE